MSGYLQRLVSIARTPRTAIRPVLGSLFSNTPHRGTAESFQELEETVLSRQPEFLATPVLRTPQGVQPAPEPHSAWPGVSHGEPHAQASQATVSGSGDEAFQAKERRAEGGQPEGSRPISETQTSFTPLVTEVPQDNHPVLEANNKNELWVRQSKGAGLPFERSDRQVTGRVSYRPLMAEGLRPTDAGAIRNSSPLTSEGRRIGTPALARRVAQPEVKADEIQIHIGRIEVTAVQPAPPRPAAQPVRKSLRLDEYLRRGRERAL